jgi:hypothetical protein
MPVILATQEAEIKRIVVQSQLGQIVQKTVSQKCPTRKGVCGMAVAECLHNKCQTLAQYLKKKKKKEREKEKKNPQCKRR